MRARLRATIVLEYDAVKVGADDPTAVAAASMRALVDRARPDDEGDGLIDVAAEDEFSVVVEVVES